MGRGRESLHVTDLQMDRSPQNIAHSGQGFQKPDPPQSADTLPDPHFQPVDVPFQLIQHFPFLRGRKTGIVRKRVDITGKCDAGFAREQIGKGILS